MREWQEIQALPRRDGGLSGLFAASPAFAETRFAPPKFPVPAAMYALESVAAAFFYIAVILGVIGTIGLARASVERRTLERWPVLVLSGAVVFAGLAMVSFIASPRHTLPF